MPQRPGRRPKSVEGAYSTPRTLWLDLEGWERNREGKEKGREGEKKEREGKERTVRGGVGATWGKVASWR